MGHLRHGDRDSVVDAALDAMDAEQLRELIRATRCVLGDRGRSGRRVLLRATP